MKILIEESVLRQALEFVEYQSNKWNGTGVHPMSIVTALRSALDAKEQVEPVAWLYEHDGMVYDASNPDLISTTRWSSCKEPWSETPLYAAPPTPSVPMSEVKEMVEMLHMFHRDFADYDSYNGEATSWSKAADLIERLAGVK